MSTAGVTNTYTQTANTLLQPISLLNLGVTVLGSQNTSGNSFVLAPSADLNDNIGLTTSRFANVFTYGISLGNTTINSYGNSTVNSSSANGYTVVSGGVILQWGTGVANTTGNTVQFAVPFPTACYSFTVLGQANIISGSSNTTKGVVTSSAGTPTFTYTAIGR